MKILSIMYVILIHICKEYGMLNKNIFFKHIGILLMGYILISYKNVLVHPRTFIKKKRIENNNKT